MPRDIATRSQLAPRSQTAPVASLLALALGAAAFGAVAVGALAIGRIAIGRLSLKRAHIDKLEVGELTVRRLRVVEHDEKVCDAPAARFARCFSWKTPETVRMTTPNRGGPETEE